MGMGQEIQRYQARILPLLYCILIYDCFIVFVISVFVCTGCSLCVYYLAFRAVNTGENAHLSLL